MEKKKPKKKNFSFLSKFKLLDNKKNLFFNPSKKNNFEKKKFKKNNFEKKNFGSKIIRRNKRPNSAPEKDDKKNLFIQKKLILNSKNFGFKKNFRNGKFSGIYKSNTSKYDRIFKNTIN